MSELQKKETQIQILIRLQERFTDSYNARFKEVFEALTDKDISLSQLNTLVKSYFNTCMLPFMLELAYNSVIDLMVKIEVIYEPLYEKTRAEKHDFLEPVKYFYKRNIEFKKQLPFIYNEFKIELEKTEADAKERDEKERLQSLPEPHIYTSFTWLGEPEQRTALYYLLLEKCLIKPDIDYNTGLEKFIQAFSSAEINWPLEIVWLNKGVLLTYLFEQMRGKYIPISTEYNSLIRDSRMFVNSKGKPFTNLKGLRISYLNNTDKNDLMQQGKPKNAELIDEILLAIS